MNELDKELIAKIRESIAERFVEESTQAIIFKAYTQILKRQELANPDNAEQIKEKLNNLQANREQLGLQLRAFKDTLELIDSEEFELEDIIGG